MSLIAVDLRMVSKRLLSLDVFPFERTLLMQNKLSTLQDVQESYAWLQEMRDTQPVWLDEDSGCWHVFRFNDVYTVSAEYHLFSSERKQRVLSRSHDASA